MKWGGNNLSCDAGREPVLKQKMNLDLKQNQKHLWLLSPAPTLKCLPTPRKASACCEDLVYFHTKAFPAQVGPCLLPAQNTDLSGAQATPLISQEEEHIL